MRKTLNVSVDSTAVGIGGHPRCVKAGSGVFYIIDISVIGNRCIQRDESNLADFKIFIGKTIDIYSNQFSNRSLEVAMIFFTSM